MRQAIIKPGGHECPACGGERFQQGGGTLRKILFGTNAADRTITCTGCGEKLKTSSKSFMQK